MIEFVKIISFFSTIKPIIKGIFQKWGGLAKAPHSFACATKFTIGSCDHMEKKQLCWDSASINTSTRIRCGQSTSCEEGYWIGDLVEFWKGEHWRVMLPRSLRYLKYPKP